MLNEKARKEREKRERIEETRLRRERRRELRQYYAACSNGLPSSLVVFDLCHSFNKIQNDQIWCACVGVTDHYVHQKMSEDQYVSPDVPSLI